MSDPTTRLKVALEGRYSIERELGEGGMATVYLAADLKHERRVALKVLKPELAAVVGAERFLAEIKTTANLQHPHILPLFDSGQADSFLFYVMPFVEGETLRDRLEREKQLPVEEAVRIATDVADALHAAHEQGVIHRDIKPANILLSRGRPIVADFGIAFAVSAAGGGRLTETGLSMGTPYYMSPEQASADREPAAASDVYSLGCVLYEMLVGEPPHTGGSAQAVLAKILTDDAPAPTKARGSIPPNVDAAIRKALEKLPADRFTHAQGFARALADHGFRHGDATVAGVVSGESPWNRLTISFAITSALLALAFAWSWGRPPPSAERDGVPFRAGITDFQVRAALNSGVRMAISPDGSHIAVASFVDGVSMLFIRRSDQSDFQLIDGTQGAEHPGFSPDGEWLTFMQVPLGGGGDQAQIKRVQVTGGPPLPVAMGRFPHWGLDDMLVYQGPDGIYRVSPSGGEPVLIIEDRSDNAWPHLLPDGRAVIFQADRSGGRTLLLADIESGEVTDLGVRGLNPRYVPSGHLVYGAENQALMAVPFDPNTQRVTGEPTTVLPEVLVYDGGATQFSVSESGIAIYGLPGPSGMRAREMVLVDLNGLVTPTPLGEGSYATPRFSPEGRRIAYERDREIWVYNRESGGNDLLTTGGASFFPATWSPDGRHIYFGSSREGALEVDAFRRPVDQSEEAQNLLSREASQWPLSTFGDGTHLLVGDITAERGWDLLVLTEDPDGFTFTDFLRADWNESMGTISPDGKWVAYVSDESGVREVYVRSFPDAQRQARVSDGGGTEPAWPSDGASIYYLSGSKLMLASITDGQAGEPLALFEGDWVRATFSGVPVMTNWDIHPDGKSFVFIRNSRVADSSDYPAVPMEVVVNWFDELKRLVPN